MIAYLPEIYPDELIYSWFCRYYIHSGCITNAMAFQELLYNRCNNPSKEFLGHLNPATSELIRNLFPMDAMIINHTMYPQYARFIPLEQKKKALYRIEHDFCDAHHLFAVLPRTQTDSYLKYCPICVKEDRKRYGESYWHRKHQIRNMSICYKHKCLLVDSNVTAKSEQTYTFNPAEILIKTTEPQYTNNQLQIAFCKYISDVFNAPIDLKNNIPISAVLYNAMRNTKYLKASGRTRYTKILSEDINIYFQKAGVKNIASIYQIQRTILGDRFDFSVICQIAYFLNISVEDLTSPKLTKKQIMLERNTHYMQDKPLIDWIEFDETNAPSLEKIAKNIYYGTSNTNGRPERVSERIIFREFGLHKHSLNKLPKCKAIFTRYTEPYEETWARRIIWAYNKIKSEHCGLVCWSNIRKLSGVKKKNINAVIPFLNKHTDEKTVNEILSVINNTPTR